LTGRGGQGSAHTKTVPSTRPSSSSASPASVPVAPINTPAISSVAAPVEPASLPDKVKISSFIDFKKSGPPIVRLMYHGVYSPQNFPYPFVKENGVYYAFIPHSDVSSGSSADLQNSNGPVSNSTLADQRHQKNGTQKVGTTIASANK